MAVWFLATIFVLSHPARAFNIQVGPSPGCHETITGDALSAVRESNDAAAAVSDDDENDLALIRDVPFDLPDELADIGAATLLIGARENDLEGRSPHDLSSLISLHGDSEDQDAHCCRAIEDDDPDGSETALASCR